MKPCWCERASRHWRKGADMPTEISKGLVVETVGDIIERPRLILGYDTETTGLPLWNDPSDDPRQPHVIQLGMILTDVDGNEIDRLNTLVKPGAGAVMSPEALDAHGITLERAMQEGMEPEKATDIFLAWVDRAFLRVAHNESFDRRLMR
ncbi:MAG: 3'-5' exonuclease, partial [Hyphomicrobiaceae bacterium]